MASTGKKQAAQRPLRSETLFFLLLAAFFVVVVVVYALWSRFEPVGSVALLLLVGLCGMTGGYLSKLSGEIDLRPEDDPHAEVEDAAGEYGRFSPWSWWPFVCGFAVMLIFVGPAIDGWWLSGIGAVLGIIGILGHVLEYNRGHHAH